ncbi:unnamed protein product [Kuraishia capsulata CBS 1993]|uniref:J domain-containing protein n=1 Tax=Kuraishia capsulata CBS 1993 TaxID=1382522 RepID=W6MXQ7_9ASCO|nr:uncharacterized protein KUCA_T00005298001 [Kuraishia capsulata CBS 1993]CDK29310.1 unnamed protein product [Kuraishia capsulata CBS 1993]
MKISSPFLLLLLLCKVWSWSAEDYEIFEITEQLQKDMGKDTDFYTFLGLTKGADSTFDEISAAYRKRSRQFHPDKVKKTGLSNSQYKKEKKLMGERYEKLSVVGSILRGDRKERYDYFLKTGFPKWKGTGYYYSKFRPGFLAVLGFLFVLVSVFHYIAIKINSTQQTKRIESLIDEIKKKAWGGSGIPPADMSDRKIFNPNLNKTFVVKFDGSVFLVDDPTAPSAPTSGDGITYGDDGKGNVVYYDEEEQARRRKKLAAARPKQNEVLLPVTLEDVHVPTYRDLLPVRLLLFSWNSSVARYIPSLRIVLTAPKKVQQQAEPVKKAAPKKKGVRKELPNGKVVYSRKR